ncbi:hypothetical protein F383_13445 [Gossypium arboreum]|uniref:Uncharacterized protein n=1 Tax=Gossypium arboreum TaxID=29729 RepID=A0A0B0PYW1_GOSAR|nr:hypothetical protein F383_13445 [Gossypium arboreum]
MEYMFDDVYMFIKLSLFVYSLLSFGKLTLCVYHLFYRYRSY